MQFIKLYLLVSLAGYALFHNAMAEPTFVMPLTPLLMSVQDAIGMVFSLIPQLVMALPSGGRPETMGPGLFIEACPHADKVCAIYSAFCQTAVFLYFILCIDPSVFSARVSALILAIFRVLSELWLCLFGLSLFLLAFGSKVSALEKGSPDLAEIPQGALSVLKNTFGMYN